MLGEPEVVINRTIIEERVVVQKVEIPIRETLASCYDRVLQDLDDDNRRRRLLNQSLEANK